jgi:hypothetical protein
MMMVSLVLMFMFMRMFVGVAMLMVVLMLMLVGMRMRVTVAVIVPFVVSMMMVVPMPMIVVVVIVVFMMMAVVVRFVLIVRVGGTLVDPEFHAFHLPPLFRSKCMWKSPISSLESSHSRVEGLTPRSTRAPTVMSPLMPEKQSRKRTFMEVEEAVLAVRDRRVGGDRWPHRKGLCQ